MPVALSELEYRIAASSLGSTSRHFFEAMALPELKRSMSHANTLYGVESVDGKWFDDSVSSHIWILSFSWRNHRFLIDTNDHAGLSEFLVTDPECPTDILLVAELVRFLGGFLVSHQTNL